MATIRTRRRSDGSLAYLSEIRIKRDGQVVHRESKTFDRKGQARAWAATREKRLAKVDLLKKTDPYARKRETSSNPTEVSKGSVRGEANGSNQDQSYSLS